MQVNKDTCIQQKITNKVEIDHLYKCILRVELRLKISAWCMFNILVDYKPTETCSRVTKEEWSKNRGVCQAHYICLVRHPATTEMSWLPILEYRGYICIQLFLHLDKIHKFGSFPFFMLLPCNCFWTLLSNCHTLSHNTYEFVQDNTACHHMRKTLCGILSMCTQ